MPITYSIDPERRLLLAVAEGSVTYTEIAVHLAEERADEGLPLSELIDATKATAEFSPGEVRQIVDLLRSLGRSSALGPTGVLVGNDVTYGLLRMLEMLVEDVCDIRPFRSRSEAEEWLSAIPGPRLPSEPG